MADTNKHRGEIALPEAGKGALICVDVNALEVLETEYGEEYFKIITDGMAKARTSVYRKVIGASLRNGDMDGFPWDIPLVDLQHKVLDSMYVSLFGKTFEEKQAEDEEAKKKEIDETARMMAENPQMSQVLSLLSRAGTDIVQD